MTDMTKSAFSRRLRRAIGLSEIIALTDAIERGLGTAHSTAILREVLRWIETLDLSEDRSVDGPPWVIGPPVTAVSPGGCEGFASVAAAPAAKSSPSPKPGTVSPDRENVKSGKWTIEEDDRLAALRREGMTIAAIAKILGRTKQTCSVRYYNVIRPRLAAADAAGSTTAAPLAVPTITVKPTASAPDQGRATAAAAASAIVARDFISFVPGWRREIEAHLDALGHTGPWSPSRDFDIVDAALRSASAVHDLAEDLGIAREALVSRFRALSAPGRDGNGRLPLEFQERLRQILDDRAHGARPVTEAAE